MVLRDCVGHPPLVMEVSRLNNSFRDNGVPAKILLLCRTDLYEKLPGANKNKLRQDAAITLDWYRDPRQPGGSNLIQLVNLKARVTDPSVTDIFKSYFPDEVRLHKVRRGRTEPVMQLLLDFTRHTPRDFLQALKHIQQFAVETPHPLIRRKLTSDQVMSGLRSYSINYFLPEIKDELVGYFSASTVEAAFSLIGSLRKREFVYEELKQKASQQSRFAELDLPGIVTALFECSAIGNIHHERRNQHMYYFKYRNRNSTLNLDDTLILHKGLWRALNLG
jgi:hypothetical protein